MFRKFFSLCFRNSSDEFIDLFGDSIHFCTLVVWGVVVIVSVREWTRATQAWQRELRKRKKTARSEPSTLKCSVINFNKADETERKNGNFPSQLREINSIIWYALFFAKHFCVWFIWILQMTLTIDRVWFSDVQFYAKHFSVFFTESFFTSSSHTSCCLASTEMRDLRLKSVQQTFWKFIGSRNSTPSSTHLSFDELDSRTILAWAIIISTETTSTWVWIFKKKKKIWKIREKWDNFPYFLPPSSADVRARREVCWTKTQRASRLENLEQLRAFFNLNSFTRV